jgi:hypothetical protein
MPTRTQPIVSNPHTLASADAHPLAADTELKAVDRSLGLHCRQRLLPRRLETFHQTKEKSAATVGRPQKLPIYSTPGSERRRRSLG